MRYRLESVMNAEASHEVSRGLTRQGGANLCCNHSLLFFCWLNNLRTTVSIWVGSVCKEHDHSTNTIRMYSKYIVVVVIRYTYLVTETRMLRDFNSFRVNSNYIIKKKETVEIGRL